MLLALLSLLALLPFFVALFFWLRHVHVDSDPMSWEEGRRTFYKNLNKEHFTKISEEVKVTESYFVSHRKVELFVKRWEPAVPHNHATQTHKTAKAGVDKTSSSKAGSGKASAGKGSAGTTRADGDGWRAAATEGSETVASRELRGIVVYLHGYGGTSWDSMRDVGDRLAREGYVVFGLDHACHGLSAGLHCYIRQFDDLVEDAGSFIRHVKSDASLPLPPLPVFLLAESMGANVGLQLHLKDPHVFAGAVLCAPFCKIEGKAVPPPLAVSIITLVSALLPDWKLVPLPADSGDSLVRDPHKRVEVEHDPIVYKGKPRLQTAVQLLKAGTRVGSLLHQVSMPLLILHGSADSVCPPSTSLDLFNDAVSKDKQRIVFEDSWHTLLSGEPPDVTEKVMDTIVSWLHSRTSLREPGEKDAA